MMTVILDDFIQLCDNSLPSISEEMSIQEQYAILGIENTNSFSISVMTDKLCDNILQALPCEDIEISISYFELDKLKKGLVYKEAIEKKNYDDYIDILEILNGLVGAKIARFIPLSDKSWEDIISNIKNYLVISDSLCGFKEERCRKEKDQVEKALKLSKYGCKISLDNVSLVINNLDPVFKLITNKIKKIGGSKFIELLISQLPYIKEFNRFLNYKQSSQGMPVNIRIEAPYNYLMNLGFRYVKYEGLRNYDIRKDFLSAIELATDLCFALYPVQPYSIWEDIFHRDRTPLQFFKDLIIKESVFELNQQSPEFVKELCRYIIKALGKKDWKNKLGYSLEEYGEFMDYLMSISKHNKFVDFMRYKIDSGIDTDAIDKILEDISADSDTVNAKFLSPLDYEEVTYWQKPIIKCNGGRYAIIPLPLGFWGCYEALISSLRRVEKNIDNRIGIILEEYVKCKLLEHNIQYSCGEYSKPEKGECDIVIESEEAITLIECKKKSLTRKAKSGQDYQIILDISNSILDSQVQCMRTEDILRRDSQVELQDGLSSSILQWNNRTVERITLTFAEYGAIQDRMMIKEVLKELRKYNFQVTFDKAHDDKAEKNLLKKKYADLEDKQEKLRHYCEAFQEKDDFFNCWFLNLEQIDFIINHSNGNESFYTTLKDWKYVTMGTKDFYQEYYVRHLMAK